MEKKKFKIISVLQHLERKIKKGFDDKIREANRAIFSLINSLQVMKTAKIKSKPKKACGSLAENSLIPNNL